MAAMIGLGIPNLVGEVGVELGADTVAGHGRIVPQPRVVASPIDMSLQRLESAPTQKLRPDPVTTMTRTVGSSVARARSARYSVCIRPVHAFIRSGRDNVMVATARVRDLEGGDLQLTLGPCQSSVSKR